MRSSGRSRSVQTSLRPFEIVWGAAEGDDGVGRVMIWIHSGGLLEAGIGRGGREGSSGRRKGRETPRPNLTSFPSRARRSLEHTSHLPNYSRGRIFQLRESSKPCSLQNHCPRTRQSLDLEARADFVPSLPSFPLLLPPPGPQSQGRRWDCCSRCRSGDEANSRSCHPPRRDCR